MTVSRRTVLASTLAVAAAPRAWAEPRLSYGLEPREVADGLWLVQGSMEYFSFENGGNIVNTAFAETEAGAVIFDTGPSRRYGEELRKVVTEIVPRGIAAVTNSHQHPDHFLGNQVFADLPIHALEETRKQILAHGEGYAENMYRLVGDWMRGTEVVPPNAILTGTDLTIGGRAFSAIALAGHTKADLLVLDRKTGTAIAGDLAFHDRAPTTPDADLRLWRDSLAAIAGLKPTGIVPGHGPFDPASESLGQTRAYLDWLDQVLMDAAEEGLDMVETMRLPMPERFAKMGSQPQEFERSVSHLFGEYERAALPEVN